MKQVVHVGEEGCFAVFRNLHLRQGLAGLAEVVVDFLLAQLADADFVVQTGDGGDFLFTIEVLGGNLLLQFVALFGIGTVDGIDEHVGLLVAGDVAANGLAEDLRVAIDV